MVKGVHIGVVCAKLASNLSLMQKAIGRVYEGSVHVRSNHFTRCFSVSPMASTDANAIGRGMESSDDGLLSTAAEHQVVPTGPAGVPDAMLESLSRAKKTTCFSFVPKWDQNAECL